MAKKGPLKHVVLNVLAMCKIPVEAAVCSKTDEQGLSSFKLEAARLCTQSLNWKL